MTNKDLELLELLLEDFCKKSEMCQKCSYRHQDNNRYYCFFFFFFGFDCIYKKVINRINENEVRNNV